MLPLVLAAYLMVILDVSIVITALPGIQTSLDFSAEGLTWVQNAYTLMFGGLLLLGARAGDLLGRRRTFLAGVALFTVASLLAGLAQSAGWLVAARALQGLGAAFAAPSTLALLATAFDEGPARTRALAWYAAVAGAGGSIGLVLGGVLADWASWRWAMLVNVPVGVAVLALGPRHLPETARRPGRFDLAGGLTSTLGMTALVWGVVHAADDGWGAATTIVPLLVGTVLLVAFALVERRTAQPITPPRLLADRERTAANLTRLLLFGAIMSTFFFLTQHLQGTLRYSPLQAGLAFLPMTVAMFAAGRLVPRMIARVGPSPVLIGGLTLGLGATLWLGRLTETTAYLPAIGVPLAVLGTGMGMALTPLTAAGVAGVAPEDAGAAAGLVNVAQQIGSALGVGILLTVFSGVGATTIGHRTPHDLAHGVAAALDGSAVLLALGLVVALVVRRGGPAPAPRPAARPAAER